MTRKKVSFLEPPGQTKRKTDLEQHPNINFSSRMRALLGVSQLERCHHPDFILEQVFPRVLYILSSVLMMIDFYVFSNKPRDAV